MKLSSLNPFRRSAKPDIQKGFTDAQWGENGAATAQNALGFRAQRSLDKALSAQECYQLVIAARRGVSAIALNLSKCKVRLFGRSGEEIVGGDLYELLRNPAPRMTTSDFIYNIASWWNVENEIAIALYPDGSMPIGKMRVLNPGRLWVNRPANILECHGPDEVVQWRYDWYGAAQEFLSARYVMFKGGFNPNNPVRGLSPFITGSNEASGQYQITRYNKTFFENGAVPSHILRLGKGVPKQDRDAFETKYLAQFGTYNDNAHKVMVVSGGKDDVNVEMLERETKDGEFLALSVNNKGDLASLLGVPPIVVGIHDQTRFETAEVQRQQFYEDTLCPQATTISEILQTQLVDPFFAMDMQTKRADAKMSGRLEKAYGDALEQRPDSNVVVLLDTDTMPIMAQIRKKLVELAGEMCEKIKLTPNEAASYVGLELPEDKSGMRDIVYVKTTEAPLSSPEMMNRMNPPKPDANNKDPNARPSEAKPDAPAGEHSRANKAMASKLDRTIHGAYRKLFVAAAENGALPRLAELDAIDDADDLIKSRARTDYLALHPKTTGMVPTIDTIKAYFNATYTKPRIAALLS